MKFNYPKSWMNSVVNIHLVGAGANGSHILDGLVTIGYTLKKLGHPGIHVTLYDNDDVSETNIARSQFYPQDVGFNKAIVLINRINQFHHLNWEAQPRLYDPNPIHDTPNLIISCVDSVKARLDIHKAFHEKLSSWKEVFWLDTGNGDTYGQVVFGQFKPANVRELNSSLRLKTFIELNPKFLDETISHEDEDAPSCSVEESIARQSMFINKTVSTFALYLLSSIFTEGGLENHHGYFINMKNGYVTPLKIDVNTWRRMQGKKPIKQ